MPISATHPLAEHIVRLLHRHECVIVPQIGAFITQHQPTQFTLDGQLTSPKLSVRFDAGLQQADNLLIIEIAHSEHLSYSLAIKKLETYTAQWQHIIAQQGFIELNSIGRLCIDAAQEWTFTAAPDALQAEVFGMPALVLKPLKGKHYDFSEPAIKLRRYGDDTPTPNDAPTRPLARKNKFVNKWSIAVAAVVMFAVLWRTYQTVLASSPSIRHYNGISANEKINVAPSDTQKTTFLSPTAQNFDTKQSGDAVVTPTSPSKIATNTTDQAGAHDATYTDLQKNAVQPAAARPQFLKPPKYASAAPEILTDKKVKPVVAKPMPTTVVAKKDTSKNTEKNTASKIVSLEKVNTYIFSLGVFQNIQFADRFINIAQQRNDNLTTKTNEKGLVVVSLIAQMPQSKLPAYLLQIQKSYGVKALVVQK